MAHPDMREKKQVTVRMTEQFAKDLNLIFASYGLSDATDVVRKSVASQATAVRQGLKIAPEIQPDRPEPELNGAEKWRLYNYGLSPEAFDAILDRQGGGCAGCGSTDRLVVDHDHACCPGPKSCGKCVRGILCGSCNTALGMVDDDVDRLRRLIDYLV